MGKTLKSNLAIMMRNRLPHKEYDLCDGVIGNEIFDIIIVEQVLENCFYPYRAVRNLYSMLKPVACRLIMIFLFFASGHVHNTKGFSNGRKTKAGVLSTGLL
jgi:hypothetical protein